MADAQSPLPPWWAESAIALLSAATARLGWLHWGKRRSESRDRRASATAAVLAEIETSRPAPRLPTPWIVQVREEATAVSLAHMRAHEEAIRPRVEELVETRHRIASLEGERERTALALERLTDQLRDDRIHMDDRLDRLADALSCRACSGGSR
jgi:hypothetical protein